MIPTRPPSHTPASADDASNTHVPLVSVVMPVHNAQRYLAEAIESILKQTFTDFEFIIIDDGSTDESAVIMQDYARRDARVRVHCQPKRGVVCALNKGLSVANAPLIARMDADDVALPARFEKQVEYLVQHPECVMVGTDVLFIDEDGAPIMLQEHHRAHHAIDAELLKGIGGAMRHPAVMGRREAIARCGGYHSYNDTAQDIDLFLRLGEIGQLANIPETLLHYRVHAQSVSQNKQELQSQAVQAALKHAWVRRSLKGAPPEVWDPGCSGELWRSYRLWTLWALRGGNPTTARKFARRLLWRRPFKIDSWRVCYWALQGRL